MGGSKGRGEVGFAGLTGPGLYQINVTIPAATPDDDAQVVAQARRDIVTNCADSGSALALLKRI
ncbi:MAG: hypothetical protein DMG57_44230 [Acidobacteria bacterium]|nr:MAG: hypothetical protein DMG57_44230 [Acidobacteriota bacterium]